MGMPVFIHTRTKRVEYVSTQTSFADSVSCVAQVHHYVPRWYQRRFVSAGRNFL
jgi:hypothetical protein